MFLFTDGQLKSKHLPQLFVEAVLLPIALISMLIAFFFVFGIGNSVPSSTFDVEPLPLPEFGDNGIFSDNSHGQLLYGTPNLLELHVVDGAPDRNSTISPSPYRCVASTMLRCAQIHSR